MTASQIERWSRRGLNIRGVLRQPIRQSTRGEFSRHLTMLLINCNPDIQAQCNVYALQTQFYQLSNFKAFNFELPV